MPKFVPRDVAERIAAEVRPTAEEVAAGRYRGPLRTRIDPEGVYRVYDAETSISPTSRQFFECPFVAGVADALTVTGMSTRDRYVDYKARIGGREINVNYHIDHWKTRLKAFLMLGDVTEDQAPFHYLVGSHRDAPWRRRADWRYQRFEAQGGVVPERVVERLKRRYGYEERVYTGEAGDLVIADTRGIHRGSVLRRGTRLQLVHLFAANGPDDYAR